MYQEVTIIRSGLQITEIGGDEHWQDEDDLLDAMREGMGDAAEAVELGVDPLPSWAEDIRPHCRAHRIWAYRYPGGPRTYYAGINERD